MWDCRLVYHGILLTGAGGSSRAYLVGNKQLLPSVVRLDVAPVQNALHLMP